MRRRIGWLAGGAVLLLAGVSAAESAAPPFEGQVSREEANVRAGSTVGSEALAVLPRGGRVSVLGEHAGWYRVRLPPSARCYVAAKYVDAQGVVTGEGVNVRAGAGLSFSILGALRRGDHLRVLERQAEWARVEPPPSLHGWIRADLVAPVAASAAAPATTTTAAATPDSATPTPAAAASSSGLAATTVATLAADASKATATLPPAATGVVETTRGFRKPGPYCLTQGGQTIGYLRSTDVDLAPYRHQRVAVWGTMDPAARSPHPVITVVRVERAE